MKTVTFTNIEKEIVTDMIQQKQSEIFWAQNESFSNIESVKAQKIEKHVENAYQKIVETMFDENASQEIVFNTEEVNVINEMIEEKKTEIYFEAKYAAKYYSYETVQEYDKEEEEVDKIKEKIN
jgi:hypothetical protein